MKQRLDVALVERGLIASREKAKVVIMEGLVYVNGQKADKAGENVAEDAQIEVRSNGKTFVSRGGKKIEKALGYFQIDPSGLVCMDIGAS
ncbi:MAG: TlyA family RNA methyltransferase, partial [Clostridium sp.]|nr:TlyA family RNA methyltransferase [Clostridium sp.]